MARYWIIEAMSSETSGMVYLSSKTRTLYSKLFFMGKRTKIIVFDDYKIVTHTIDRVRLDINATAKIKEIDAALAKILSFKEQKPWPPAEPRFISGIEQNRPKGIPEGAERPISIRKSM